MKYSTRSQPLPQLPFGNREAMVERNAQAFVDRMATVITSLKSYDPLEGPQRFASKTHTLTVNGVRLVAAANTPVSADVGETSDTTLMVPFAGHNVTLIDNKELHWVAGHGAVYLPSTARGGYCSTRATLNVSLNKERLTQTAKTMLGYERSGSVDLQLDQARTVSFQSYGFDFDAAFRHICGLIDGVGGNVRALELTGLDDLLYRNIVLMLRPDIFVPMLADDNGDAAKMQHHRILDPLCDYLRAHLGERITLSGMERFTGMSSRGLQYAFMHRFGCSPMQWLRGARLDRTRDLLASPDVTNSITEMALSHGFAKPSDFAEHYRRRFGELPSETRARKGAPGQD